MRRNVLIALMAGALTTLATAAYASPHHGHRHAARTIRVAGHHAVARSRLVRHSGRHLDFSRVAERQASPHRLSDPRPRAWCGWQMRRLVGSDPGRAYNLARNWAHWGRPAGGPAPGAIGVMPHHVFKVIRVLDSHTVLAISGNDGHAVRVRPRSTARVIAWRSA